ncbi:MAG: chemotaxis protein CheD [Spirochaetes bacterium]|nr:chemotaxis protein CheD [Spirochaetota bacterium]
MIKSEKNSYGQPLYILFPGEFFASSEKCIIGSIAGATLLVCLYDQDNKTGGMAHFIVPGTMSNETIISDNIAKFGIQNMELLIGEIIKKGGDRRRLIAKLFGAAYIKESIPNMGGVQKSNIRFLHEYFALEDIQILREDLGGEKRRKVYFFTETGKALRRFQKSNEDISEFLVMEKEYFNSVFNKTGIGGQVIFFD